MYGTACPYKRLDGGARLDYRAFGYDDNAVHHMPGAVIAILAALFVDADAAVRSDARVLVYDCTFYDGSAAYAYVWHSFFQVSFSLLVVFVVICAHAHHTIQACAALDNSTYAYNGIGDGCVGYDAAVCGKRSV